MPETLLLPKGNAITKFLICQVPQVDAFFTRPQPETPAIAEPACLALA